MKKNSVLVLFGLALVGLCSVAVAAGPSSAPRWLDVDGSVLPMFSAVELGSDLWVVVKDGSVGRIVKWNGSLLEPAGLPVEEPDDVHLMNYQGELYAGGFYLRGAGVGAWWGLRKWDGSTWVSVIDPGSWEVHSFTGYAVLRDTLYIVGHFRGVSGTGDFYLARVEGSNLIGIPADFSGSPAAIAAFQGQLFISVTGSHGSATAMVPRVYRFDGLSCVPLTGSDGQTLVGTATTSITGSSFFEYQGDLFVSGLFKLSGASELTSIAKWDGDHWSDMNLNLPRDAWGGIGSMVNHNDKLIASYCAADRSIWQFTNSSWTKIGQLAGQAARQLLVRNGQLLVLGEFTSIDNAAITYAATPNFCCIGTRGNVSGDPTEAVDLSDLSALIAFMTAGTIPPSTCPMESDVNGSLQIDLTDLSILIAYLTQTENRPVLTACP